MVLNLRKGEKVELTKGNPNLKKIKVCLGWQTNKYDGGKDFDLDASVFLLNNQDMCTSDEDIVFYKNLRHRSGSVIHSGDDRTGGGKGDNEIITIDLPKVPANIEKLSAVITIYDAEVNRQNFGMVNSAYVRVLDDAGKEILRYNLGEDFSIETAIVTCEIYRYQGEWKFAAVGSGYSGGLAQLCKSHGLVV